MQASVGQDASPLDILQAFVHGGGSGAAATVANPMVSLIMFLIKFSSL